MPLVPLRLSNFTWTGLDRPKLTMVYFRLSANKRGTKGYFSVFVGRSILQNTDAL